MITNEKVIFREKEIIAGHVVTVNVRIFIQHWEKQVLHFVSHFQRLTIQDEKVIVKCLQF